jgi:acyl-CoA synthetase (AMP-forming)/AMP-acid ligase II
MTAPVRDGRRGLAASRSAIEVERPQRFSGLNQPRRTRRSARRQGLQPGATERAAAGYVAMPSNARLGYTVSVLAAAESGVVAVSLDNSALRARAPQSGTDAMKERVAALA